MGKFSDSKVHCKNHTESGAELVFPVKADLAVIREPPSFLLNNRMTALNHCYDILDL